MVATSAIATPPPPASNRITIDLGQGVPDFVGNVSSSTPASPQNQWWYENNQDSNPTSTTFAATTYTEVAAPAADLGPSCGSTLSTPDWSQVGVPTDANIYRTFINQAAGGGQGSLCGQNNWYRLHFKVDPTYANDKVEIEFEGAQTGIQIYINGTLLQGISAVSANASASHVVGFIPVVADITPYIHADGATDNVLAVSVSRGNSWFEDPQFSEVFRFGQAMAGLFRPVKMFITNKTHIPVNVYSNQKTWGTYVATVSETPSSTSTAQAASAVIQVEANVLNETTAAESVTVTNQIVDENGNVVVTGTPITQTVNPMTAGNFPNSPTGTFSQQITMTNPTLWYPNNSIYGTPYMYTVNSIVSVGGTVVDVAQSPLGVRTITWDTNFPYFNGHPMNLWGGSGRYDYPGLGSSVPEEQQWRDLQLLAAEGGNIWRPGHSSSSEEFVAAADELGVMIDQPSGDNEEYFAPGNPTADSITLKEELHRDMIVRDRNHPSILDWESNNGTMEESIGTALLSLNSTWDPINTRVAADRTPDNVNGYLLGCTLEGCEVGVKTTTDSSLGQNLTNNPAWGSEYWGTGTARGLAWNYELAFIAPFLDNWRKSVATNCMGMAQWYLTDTPGETGQYVEAGNSTTAPGNSNDVRSLGASSMDQNRLPKLLYYAYEAAWTPYSIKPVVKLAGHWNWNVSGNVQVNAFSNCPSVRLLLNGVQQGSVETPNPADSNDESNQTQTATQIPFQASWQVPFAAGTITVQGLDAAGNVVATDSRTTAGAESKIVLTVTPELTKPDGTNFQVKANGSDAAFVTATVEDANGNWEPLATDTLTFSVSGPATYMGGTQQYVSTNTDAYSNANSTYVNGVPDAFYEAPGDPQLTVEGGITRVALRSQFTAGTVTVTATAPGLTSGSTTFNVVAVPDPRTAPTNTCAAVPGAPGGLAATAASASDISLVWTATAAPTNCSVNTYNVYRSTTSGFTPSTSNQIGNNIEGASYDDTNALAGSTTYYYVVKAIDSYGMSAGSNQASATTPAGAPPATPANLAASYGNDLVSLGWGAVSGATSYNVYRGTSSGGESATPLAAGVTSASYADSAVTNGTTYYYEVAAVNANGTSGKSNEAAATPSNQTDIIAINCGGSAVTNWVADEDFTGGTADVTTNTISTSGVPNPAPAAVYQSNRYGNTTYTIGGFTAGTSYTVRLHFCETYFTAAGDRTFDVSINGNQVLTNFDIYATAGATNQAVVEQFTATANGSGQIVIATTTVINNAQINGIEILGSSGSCTSVPPTGPTSLSASAISSSSIGLSWPTGFANPPCTVTAYDVFRSTTNGFAPSASNMIASGVTGTTYTDTGLAASTTYYYLVETLDSFGASAASPQASATTSASGGGGGTGGISINCGGAAASPFVADTDFVGGAAASVTNTITTNLLTGTAPPQAVLQSNRYGTFTYTIPGLTAGSSYPVTLYFAEEYWTAAGKRTFDVSINGTQVLTNFDIYATAGAEFAAVQENFTATANGSGDIVITTTNVIDNAQINGIVVGTSSGGGGGTAPSAPTGLTATAGNAQVALSWTGSTGATSYNVYRGTTSGGESATALATGLTGTTYTDSTAANGTTYYYKVAAVDASGTSGMSNEASATPSGGGSGSGGIAIDCGGAASGSWVADTDFAGGGTQVVTNTITTNLLSGTIPPQTVLQSNRYGAFTYTIPGLTAGASYPVTLYFAEEYWTAAGQRTFDVSINGTQVLTNFDIFATAGAEFAAVEKSFTATANSSGDIVITTTNVIDNAQINGILVGSGSGGGGSAPSAPTGLTASGGNAQVALGGTASSGATSYNVYRGTTSGGESATALATGLTGTSYTDSSVTNGTTYYYKVAAVDASGTSGMSNEASATPAAAATIEINAGGTATGSWAADEDFTGGGTDTWTNTVATNLLSGTIPPQAVLQTDREGTFTYTIPGLAANSSHTVTLYFVEQYWTAAGKRVFSVTSNGTTEISNLDIYATAGGDYIAIEKSFTTTASASGQIVLGFTPSADQAKCSGIVVQ